MLKGTGCIDSISWVFGKHSIDQFFSFFGNFLEHLVAESYTVVADIINQLILVIVKERVLATDELVHHDSTRPDVHWLLVRLDTALLYKNLRRHEVGRPQDVILTVRALLRCFNSQSEVNDIQLELIVQQAVAWFKVSMHYAIAVHVIDSGKHHSHKFAHVVHR